MPQSKCFESNPQPVLWQYKHHKIACSPERMIREEVWSRSVWYALSMALMHALREISSNEDADTKMLSVARFEKVSSKYTKILDEGRTELPECPPRKGKRGRIPKSEAEKLHEAFVKYKNDTLRFAKLSEVPFSNNRAYADKFAMPAMRSKGLISLERTVHLSA